jgi:hypothetical protein
MSENARKPLTVLPGGMPALWRDFVRCRRDSIDIEPGELDWVPNLPSLTLSFEQGSAGVTLRLSGLGGLVDIGIPVSVRDGRLVADTSDVPVPGDAADGWIDNLNADLEANGMQFSDAALRGGKLHLAKKQIAAGANTATTAGTEQPPMPVPPPPAHVVDPIPQPEPTPPPMPVPAPPAHITDPIPESAPVGAGAEVSDESVPHGDQAALQLPHSFGAAVGVTKRWSKWSRVGAATAGAFVLSVAGFFIFVDGQSESPQSVPPSTLEDGALDSASPQTTSTDPPSSRADEDDQAAATTAPPESVVKEPIALGFDETGDQEDGATSEKISPGQEIPGGDITEVSHRMDTNGAHTIVFHLAGDGMQFTEPGSAWYDVIVSAEDSAGGVWRANGAWFSGQYSDRGIRLGPSAPGQTAIPDGEVVITFLGSDSFEMTIDGGGEPLELSTFAATVGVSVDGETRWDSALGEAGPP